MRIQIWLFILLRIRIRLFTLKRIQSAELVVWYSTCHIIWSENYSPIEMTGTVPYYQFCLIGSASFGKLDPDLHHSEKPDLDLHHKVKSRIRIRITDLL